MNWGAMVADDRHVTAALERLRQLAANRPELRALAELTGQLLRTLFADSGTRPAGYDASSAARAGLAIGAPLFRTAPPPLDSDRMRRSWAHGCLILGEAGRNEDARRLADAVARGRLDPGAQLLLLLREGPAACGVAWEKSGCPVALGQTVLRLCALPLLAPWAGVCEALWQTVSWQRGFCPLCGNGPLLAEFRGLEQLRWLRCGWCAAQWQVDRLFCPQCQNRDHRRLEDWLVDGQEHRYRLSVCGCCDYRLAGLATLNALNAPELLAAEVELLHLQFVSPPGK